MRRYKYALDYDDPILAELYDQQEDYLDDVQLLLELVGGSAHLKILEPFSGTGRVLIPLTLAGHRVTGIEIAPSMGERARSKSKDLSIPVGASISILIGDALQLGWGEGLDLVILGSNCLYELSTVDQQIQCIEKAALALRQGGRVFVDNNNYRGDWGRDPFPQERVVLEGTAADGSQGQLVLRSLGFDEETQTLTMQRQWSRRALDSPEYVDEYSCCRRPVSGKEVRSWLEQYDFHIERSFGNRAKEPFSVSSDRAIFWARRR
jgi:SAM-dependent methyltransferase